MKTVIKGLVATLALAASASTLAVPVTLQTVGLRAASGTYYSLFFNGSDGGPVSTATPTSVGSPTSRESFSNKEIDIQHPLRGFTTRA